MPTYEYKCQACGHAFEKFQSIMAGPVKKCPVCGKNKVKRLISSGAGLIFKGSGFYITDYRSDAYKNSAKSDSAPAAASTTEKTADTKPADSSKTAESKPAAAAESKPAAPAAESKPKSKSPKSKSRD
jgi:putative FmdB family regulatory protein